MCVRLTESISVRVRANLPQAWPDLNVWVILIESRTKNLISVRGAVKRAQEEKMRNQFRGISHPFLGYTGRMLSHTSAADAAQFCQCNRALKSSSNEGADRELK